MNLSDTDALEAAQDCCVWLDTEMFSALDCAPRSRSGRVIKAKTKEWPPRCPLGFCDMRKGCMCTHSTTVASDYFDCVSEIYGPDAPGMPAARPSAVPTEGADVHTTPSKSSKSSNSSVESETPPVKRGRGRPRGSAGEKRRKLQQAWDKMEGPREECDDDDEGSTVMLISPLAPMSAVVETVVIEPVQPPASAETLMLLFSDSRSENDAPPNIMLSPVSVYDLLCEEDPAVAMGDVSKKRVTWTGLPANPPTWVTGRRRTVPQTWKPCSHVVVLDGLMCLHDRQAPSSLIKTLSCSAACPVWV